MTLGLITWNIQWGMGVDRAVDLGRIAGDIRSQPHADVICLQEVTDGFDDLPGNDGADQFALLAALFPDYQAVSFAPMDLPGPVRRRRFGNMILSRLPIGQVLRHSLPWRSADGAECMARGLIELVVATPRGPLRIMTTHLEWSSTALRRPQIKAIRAIHRDACRRVLNPPKPGKGPYQAQGGAIDAILTADFNMRPEDPLLKRLQEPFADARVPRLVDAWSALRPGEAHPPSMCLHDQSDGPPRCLDFILTSASMTDRLRAIRYDQTSRSSDHQPVILEWE